ncbi:MAG: hypothetical protein CVU56_19445 [Deltaproteobacteria bacterium HGW-Deltaproteobacteria-14]|nr:MAG: hypothetical protein CVU56_19445 [Deltaproteobacteria bacterium HGW-Deltaproteobacteria-14]
MDISDFDFDEPEFVAEDDATVSVDAAELRARSSRAAAPPDDDGESTVAMQIPQELLDENAKGAKRTIMGHPGISPRTANAVRGGAPLPRRNETLAMDSASVQRAAAARATASDDDDESTMAMNVDDMLAKIDDRPAPRRSAAPAPADDDDESTMAMNVDDMLAEIDDRPAPRSAPARSAPPARRAAPVEEEENESTMAVDMDAMLRDIDGGAAPRAAGGDDDDEKTQAMDIGEIEMARPRPARPAPAPAPKAVAAVAAPVAAVATAAVIGGVAPAPDPSGLFGPVCYALSFDGRRVQLDEQLAALSEELQAGSGGRPRTDLARLKQQYEAERAALDPAAAKRGWITLGAVGGAAFVLFLVLGLI